MIETVGGTILLMRASNLCDVSALDGKYIVFDGGWNEDEWLLVGLELLFAESDFSFLDKC